MVTNFQEAKIQNRNALRRGLLDAASRILAENGPEALNMREVAKEVNASTKVLYTLFGSKEGLLDALYQEGFIRLREAFETITADSPLERLVLIGRTYRRFALANPNYYSTLMNVYAKSYKPSEQHTQLAVDSFATLGQSIQGCIEANIISGDAELLTFVFWAAMHGEISLELGGNLYKYTAEWREQLFELALQKTLKGFYSRDYMLKTLGTEGSE